MTEPQISVSTTDSGQLQEGASVVRQVNQALKSVLIGQDEVVEQVLIALLAGGHVLIEGVPGLGKTLLVRALAKTFGGRFARIQFTPDLMPSDVTGHTLFNMQERAFEVRKGPVFTNLLLADEINRAPAKTQAALLEVMQERQVTIEGASYPVGEPFMVLATQNPIEQDGTYPLPEAELDRFMLKIFMDYPDLEHEVDLVRRVAASGSGPQDYLAALTSQITPAELTALQQQVRQITLDQQVIDYAVRLARATRDWRGIARGAGPRGSLGLVEAARGRALMMGRGYVIPDDIKQVAPPVLRHRLLLSPDMEIEGVRADRLLADLLDQVDAPRQ